MAVVLIGLFLRKINEGNNKRREIVKKQNEKRQNEVELQKNKKKYRNRITSESLLAENEKKIREMWDKIHNRKASTWEKDDLKSNITEKHEVEKIIICGNCNLITPAKGKCRHCGFDLEEAIKREAAEKGRQQREKEEKIQLRAEEKARQQRENEERYKIAENERKMIVSASTIECPNCGLYTSKNEETCRHCSFNFITRKNPEEEIKKEPKLKTRKYKYHTVNLPETLAATIEEVIESGNHGYTSIPDFVKEAVRRQLRLLSKLS